MSTQPEALRQEWTTLQRSFEAYENGAIAIKLVAVAAFLIFASSGRVPPTLPIALLLLWIMEAMYRTYQSRLGERLLRIEAALQQGAGEIHACGLHTEWQAGRPGILGLVVQYLKSAVRPGVAVPHVLLFALTLLIAWTGP